MVRAGYSFVLRMCMCIQWEVLGRLFVPSNCSLLLSDPIKELPPIDLIPPARARNRVPAHALRVQSGWPRWRELAHTPVRDKSCCGCVWCDLCCYLFVIVLVMLTGASVLVPCDNSTRSFLRDWYDVDSRIHVCGYLS